MSHVHDTCDKGQRPSQPSSTAPPASTDSEHDNPAPLPSKASNRRHLVGSFDSDDEPPMRRPSSNGAVEVDPPSQPMDAASQEPSLAGGVQEAEAAEGVGGSAALEGRPTLRTLSELEGRLLQWQWANAEYGNSACLDKVWRWWGMHEGCTVV